MAAQSAYAKKTTRPREKKWSNRRVGSRPTTGSGVVSSKMGGQDAAPRSLHMKNGAILGPTSPKSNGAKRPSILLRLNEANASTISLVDHVDLAGCGVLEDVEIVLNEVKAQDGLFD